MLGDSELEQLKSQLGTTLQETQHYYQNVDIMLQKFQGLLDSYDRLKSEYEEATEARERYKKLARGQERNPFALVLIDGDGYLFKDHLIKSGADGGIAAARMLSDSIQDILHSTLDTQAAQCSVMVRIYANLQGLSRTLARAGLVGYEARSLSPFAASFTHAQRLFDFVDVGEKKEGADYKISEMFRLFADNSQCKHIFFGGCHDTGYLSLLTPYIGRRDRITLLRAGSFHSEYETLDLPIAELRSVFVTSPAVVPGGPAPPAPKTVICTHYQKGTCRYGAECKKLHVPATQQLTKVEKTDNHVHALAPSWRSPVPTTSRAPDRSQPYSALLPHMSAKSEESIPINKDGARIDTYVREPSTRDWDVFNRRSKKQKLCNRFHLGGYCDEPDCEFDHTEADQTLLGVLRLLLRSRPCARGPKCRSIRCYNGHHCQRDGCRGGKICKFGSYAHTLDLKVAQWVDAVDTDPHEEEELNGSISSDESQQLNQLHGLSRNLTTMVLRC